MTFSLNVTRGKSSPEGTPGKLASSAGFTCDTLELQWANNRSGVSCILPGTYSASVWFSPTLHRNVIRLEDKNGRKDCLIHNGNWAGLGAGEITQIHGCTEVGNNYGMIHRPDGILQHGILASSSTLEALIAHVLDCIGASEAFTVNYEWAVGCQPDDMTDLNGVQV